MKNIAAKLVAVGLLSLLSLSAAFADAVALKALDTDNDGTVDLAEAQTGASKVRASPNPGGGTLGDRIAAAGLDAAVLEDADADKDGTADAKEYATVIERQFKAADADNDGALDEKELSSSAGTALLKLIR
jgi:Ca2+-binding EF-hand superfamily protein